MHILRGRVWASSLMWRSTFLKEHVPKEEVKPFIQGVLPGPVLGFFFRI